jgi:hypothetical protein
MVRKGTEHTRKVGEIKIGWGIFVFTLAVSHISIVIRNNYVLLDSMIHNVVIVNLRQIHHDSFDTAFHLVSVMSKPVINKISFQIFVIHVSLYSIRQKNCAARKKNADFKLIVPQLFITIGSSFFTHILLDPLC